jgi:excisionase family DNA binding protein
VSDDLALTLPAEVVDALVERVAVLVLEQLAVSARSDTRWLTVAEAGDYLRLGRHSTYKLIERGQLPYRRVGARILLRADELDAWLDGRDGA